MGQNKEGDLGWAVIKLTARTCKTMQDKKGEGQKGFWGLRKGTLALGTSMRGTVDTRAATTGASNADGTMAFLSNAGESMHGGPTTAEEFVGGGAELAEEVPHWGGIHVETPDGAAMSNAVVLRGRRVRQTNKHSFLLGEGRG